MDSTGDPSTDKREADVSDTSGTVALFTRGELAIAFAQIIPNLDALRWADEWFDLFAGPEAIDAQGKFLWRADEQSGSEACVACLGQVASQPGSQAQSADTTTAVEIHRMSISERGEFLLRLSDFTLDLVAASSASLATAIRVARRESQQRSMARVSRMKEMLRILEGLDREGTPH